MRSKRPHTPKPARGGSGFICTGKPGLAGDGARVEAVRVALVGC